MLQMEKPQPLKIARFQLVLKMSNFEPDYYLYTIEVRIYIYK